MMAATLLVVAKAPVPGLAKTRLAATLGEQLAADIAAAALLDTLDAVAAAGVQRRVVAFTGDLDRASEAEEIRARLADFEVIAQRGDGFADRLANAHADAGELPIVQIGMDTPQVSAELLTRCAAELLDTEAVLGMARDGGWWVLGVRSGAMADCLRTVPMSTDATGDLTRKALQDNGFEVRLTDELADVDTVDDIAAVSSACPSASRFARLCAEL